MFRSTLLLAGLAVVGTAAAQPGPARYPQSRPNSSPSTAAPAVPRPAVGKPADSRAYITLMVPDGAEVWFEGQKTTATGSVREYRSPPLEPGSRYKYEIRVVWRHKGEDIRQTRNLIVTAGGTFVEDFLQRAPNVAPPRDGMPMPTTPIPATTPAPIR
jgi:uncharacterized protein (TIGR03000 family)